MCGLAGLVSPNVDPDHRRSAIECMVGALAHRGPDDRGIWINGPVAFGHVRLSILDTSGAAHQPMLSSSGRFLIAYNGEIYNFRTLRAECERRGHVFHGHGDTEVLLALISLDGVEAALPRLRGMFAFAVYDRECDRVYLARDRFGQKPCYFARCSDGTFLFASEIKALLASGFSDIREQNRDALLEYFFMGAITGTATAYQKISELPAGHFACYSFADATVEISAFGAAAQPLPPRDRSLTFDTALSALDATLTEAIELHLQSDVGMAVFLSSGIDSGIIAAICSKLGGSLRALTIASGNSHYDESAAAARIAQHYGIDHTIIPIDDNIARDIETVFACYDEPIADPSIVPTFMVTRAAANFSKVFLTGDGGDEMFLGYRRYSAALYRDRLGLLDNRAAQLLFGGLSSVIPASSAPHSPIALLKRVVSGLAMDRKSQLLDYFVQGLTKNEMASFAKAAYHPVAARIYDEVLSEPEGLSRSFLAQTHYNDLILQLPDTLLVKMDMASMYFGIETRAPFLDNAVADLALKLPVHHLLKGGKGKHILRQLARRYLPEDISNYPKKGFEIPIYSLLVGHLRSSVEESILEQPKSLLREFFDRSQLEALIQNTAKLPPQVWARKVWLIYAFAMWERTRP